MHGVPEAHQVEVGLGPGDCALLRHRLSDTRKRNDSRSKQLTRAVPVRRREGLDGLDGLNGLDGARSAKGAKDSNGMNGSKLLLVSHAPATACWLCRSLPKQPAWGEKRSYSTCAEAQSPSQGLPMPLRLVNCLASSKDCCLLFISGERQKCV